MATKTKSGPGSLAKLIQRAKEAQEGGLAPDEPAAAPVTPVPPAQAEAPVSKVVSAPRTPAAKASPKKPRAAAPAKSEPKPTEKKSKARPEPVPEAEEAEAVPELAADRRLGRRGNPNYRQANAYIPKALHLKIKLALLEDGDREFSSLVEELLEQWLDTRG